jgi:hypothetical protein
MKTLKSIQKNQAQLNSLLMEKWGYNNVLAEEAIEEEEDLSGVVMNPGEGATLEEAPTDAIKKLKKFVKKWPRRKPMPDKPEDKKPPMKPMPDKPEDKKPPMTPMQEDLETLEEHNCRAVHSGMNHDQWAEKNR